MAVGMVLSRRLFAYDIREREEVRVASGVIRGFSFSPDAASVVFGTAGRNDAADAPSDLYSVRLEDKLRQRITRDRKSLNPLWRADGIIHDRMTARDGDAPTYNLFEIQPDGGSLRRITRLRIPPPFEKGARTFDVKDLTNPDDRLRQYMWHELYVQPCFG